MLVTSSCAKGLSNPRGTLALVVLPLFVSETTSARNVPNNAGAPLAYSIWYGLVRPVIHAFDDSPNAPPTLEPVA
jgi:hypothetical protein